MFGLKFALYKQDKIRLIELKRLKKIFQKKMKIILVVKKNSVTFAIEIKATVVLKITN